MKNISIHNNGTRIQSPLMRGDTKYLQGSLGSRAGLLIQTMDAVSTF